MMQLLCNGTFLDLYEGSGLQFTHKNPLFAFDALECERTTSFKIPATPKNDRVLALAKLPALSGVAMRRKYDAELYDGTVVKKGYIYVSNFDGKDYNAIFVTGELVGLQALKNAGKIRDLLVFDQAVTWDNTTTHTADEATLPDIGFVQYERDPSTAHLNASISLRWLMEQIATKTGVTINYLNAASDERWRLLAAGADIYNLNDLAVHLVNRGAVGQDPINISSLLGISVYHAAGMYYEQCTAAADGQELYWSAASASPVQFDMLKFPYEVSLEFGEDFPDDCFLATNGYWPTPTSQTPSPQFRNELVCDMVYDEMAQDYHFRLFPHNAIANFLGDYYLLWDGSTVGAPIAGRKVTIPANTPFMILPKAGLHYQEPEAIGDTAEIGYNADECPAYDYEVRISINHDFVYGEDVPLNAMLPEFTAVELLKLYAAINGCVLNYTDAQGVTFESLDFDNYAIRDIKALTKRGELVRTFSDYAQQNIVKMTPEDWVWLGERIKTQYAIDNDNIEAEKDLLVLKASEGGKKIAYTDTGEVHTRLLVRNDAEGKRKAKDQTIALASVGDQNMLRVTIPTIGGLQNLCTASTQQKISARMTLLEYNAIQAKTLALVEGLRYIWTERSWQKNEAQFTLARLYEKPVQVEPSWRDGYQEVEWIRNISDFHRSAFIDSGLFDNVSNYKIEARFCYYSRSDKPFPSITGAGYRSCRLTPSTAYNQLAATQEGHQWVGNTDSGTPFEITGLTANTWYVGRSIYTGTSLSVQVDNRQMATIAAGVAYSGLRITLLDNYDSPSDQDSPCIHPVAYIKIWQNDVLVAEFIPCYRRTDGAKGMYDIVRDQFFGNAGTGDFEVGPDVN